jgi:N-acetylneuraminic acid mutarotase
VKVHQQELIEVRDSAVWYYHPFQNEHRRVVIEERKLAENPTVVTTKETGRLLLVGGTKGFRSSRKVYQVDECMNKLNKHSLLNVGRVGHAAVYVRNKDIYVIGGYSADRNEWMKSIEVCQDAFANVGLKDTSLHKEITWEMGAEMKEPRYFFGCCAFKDESIYVFGGMNQTIL